MWGGWDELLSRIHLLRVNRMWRYGQSFEKVNIKSEKDLNTFSLHQVMPTGGWNELLSLDSHAACEWDSVMGWE